ncbi:Mlp family lipoprotein [Borreliella lusitaniae]|uniref:Mlp family lipoprotein n=1 Tax=Borreliella lusitaniae TaxID=100177 RepID=A0ABZ0CJ93_9SPIR|nr:Mlp family lipoprotein [Borreliella lusitaniae]WNY69143.1 Mlp family lipoprotein [Borreliella lusitaniae]
MKRINILKISVLLTLLIILVFSCKHYGVKQFEEEINDSAGAKNSNASKNSETVKAVIAKSWPSLNPEEAKKLQASTRFLGEAITANGREGDERAEYEKSYREFFEWLSKDIDKQKEFLKLFDNVYGIAVKAAERKKTISHEKKELGLDEYIVFRIKESTGEALSLFFQKVADAFGTDDYYRRKDRENEEVNNQKPEKSNEEIFKVIKKLFTESEDNKELKDLKTYADAK